MFDKIYPSWLGWGLYLSTCLENDCALGETNLPYDNIEFYERSEIDKDLILYGGEIGLFKECQYNMKMLHEIYINLLADKSPVLDEITQINDKTNPLYVDIISGEGTSGKYWNVNASQKGIFNYDELEVIQKILSSPQGIEEQFHMLQFRLYEYYRNWVITTISIMECDFKAKILLATYVYWNDDVIIWVNDIKNITTLEDMANALLGILDEDEERILLLFNYINDNIG